MLKNVFEDKRLIAWLQISLILFLLVVLTVLAPIASFFNATQFSDAMYAAYGFICHQIPERSFWILGQPLAVCARCFGIYAGVFIGAIALRMIFGLARKNSISPIWVLLSLIPMGVDWSLTFFDIWDNTEMSRLVTGGIVGIACGISLTNSLLNLRFPSETKEPL